MCSVTSVMSDSATPSTVALQALQHMEFPRQEHWSGLPRPSPGDLSNSGTEPTSLAPPALAGGFFTTSTTWEALEDNKYQKQNTTIKNNSICNNESRQNYYTLIWIKQTLYSSLGSLISHSMLESTGP